MYIEYLYSFFSSNHNFIILLLLFRQKVLVKYISSDNPIMHEESINQAEREIYCYGKSSGYAWCKVNTRYTVWPTWMRFFSSNHTTIYRSTNYILVWFWIEIIKMKFVQLSIFFFIKGVINYQIFYISICKMHNWVLN